MTEKSPLIAIVGMDCLFPASHGLKSFWRLVLRGTDAIGDVPSSHWSVMDYFDADPKKPDHVYSRRGGFLSPVSFDPSEFGIPPTSLEATDTSQLLALMTAKGALRDAGYDPDGEWDRQLTSVILGITGAQELVVPLASRLGHPVWRRAARAAGVSDATAERIVENISRSYVSWRENSFPGLLGNVVAGRICNRLNLGGTNCAVDAACASSLSALHLALLELQSGKSRMVITGGVDTFSDIFMHMCFAKTMILSPSGDIRPFSRRADGTLLGEGVGMVVLKRQTDAERDGNRIYALIRGLGTASDGRSQSIYAPRVEGQVKALQNAYCSAGVDPSTVSLVEAHGTGTRVGDAVEVKALKQVYPPAGKDAPACALGAVKSMIGHTKAAAGAAGLIKAALCLHHKILPPNPKAIPVDPDLGLDQSCFYIPDRHRPWISDRTHPRRAAVSSFGFGGSNFHLVLEEHQPTKKVLSWDGSVEILAFSADDKQEIVQKLRHLAASRPSTVAPDDLRGAAADSRRQFDSRKRFRLLMALDQGRGPAAAPDFVTALVHNAVHLFENGALSGSLPSGRFYGGENPPPGKLSFLFPGQGSQYAGMGAELACIFPEMLQVLETANDACAGARRLTDVIFPVQDTSSSPATADSMLLNQTEWAQPAIGAVSLGMLKILQRFRLQPDAVCGHSFGELTALRAAGCCDDDTFLHLAAARGKAMAAAGKKGESGGMLAVQAPLDRVSAFAETSEDLVLANRNAPHQAVLSGTMQAIRKAASALAADGCKTVILPVSAAFHSPSMAAAAAPFTQAVGAAVFNAPSIAVYANAVRRPYPEQPHRIQDLLSRQLLEPVHFYDTLRSMYAAGARTFVEIGPKAVLTGLVRQSFSTASCRALALDNPAAGGGGLRQLAGLLCSLAAVGYPVDLTAWEDPPAPRRRPRMCISICGANYRSEKPTPADAARRSGAEKTDRPPANRPQGKTAPAGMPAPSRANQKSTDEEKMKQPSSQQPLFNARTRQTRPSPLGNALTTVQEGIKSMRSLHRQTAEAHRQFLDAQTHAADMLHRMLESTQRLAEAALGLPGRSDAISDSVAAPPDGPSDDARPTAAPPVASTVPAPEPPATSPPPEAATDDTADKNADSAAKDVVSGALCRIVSELTGYPPDMIDPDMDLEADLGIDSIKRVEILSALEERMPDLPAVAPDVLGTLKTLRQISACFDAPPAADKAPPPPAGQMISQSAPSAMPSVHPAPSEPPPDIDRYRAVPTATPFEKGPHPLTFAAGSVCYLLDPDDLLTEALVREITPRGCEPIPLDPPRIERLMQGKMQLNNAAGLIVVAATSVGNLAQGREFLRRAFFLAHKAADPLQKNGRRQGAFFATVGFLDGAFGLQSRRPVNAPAAGLAAIAKTAAMEWESVVCRAFDVAPDWEDAQEIARRIVEEICCADPSGPIEVGLTPTRRQTIFLEPRPYPQDLRIDIDLNASDVVLVSGGGRGVTAAAAAALARQTQATLVLLGRSPSPCDEPAWLRGVSGEAAVKRAIIKNEFNNNGATPKDIEAAYQKWIRNREIRDTLDTMRQQGIRTHYRSVDIQDKERLAAIVADIRADLGPVSAVVHGAGVLEDKAIADKSLEQFDRVFDVKVRGFEALLAATRTDALKYIVVFSSVAARFGNRGQGDYAAANEVLNKMALNESLRRNHCRVAALNWGPWDGGMIKGALRRSFLRRNIPLLDMPTGARCLLYEMSPPFERPVEIVIGSLLDPGADERNSDLSSGTEDNMSLVFKRELDTRSHPILDAHCLNGQPVVPFALMAEWFGHGALHDNPGLVMHGLDDMRLFNGIKIDGTPKVIRLYSGKAVKTDSAWQVDVELRNGHAHAAEDLHARARALLTETLPPAPDAVPPPKKNDGSYRKSVADIYENILFHGSALRGIKEVLCMSDEIMAARISAAPAPGQWIREPARSVWIADPLVLDCAFQMASLWCFEQKGLVSLPSYCAAYRQYRSPFPASGVTALLEPVRAGRRRLVAHVTFFDADDHVVARLSGLEAVMDQALFQAFKPGCDTQKPSGIDPSSGTIFGAGS